MSDYQTPPIDAPAKFARRATFNRPDKRNAIDNRMPCFFREKKS